MPLGFFTYFPTLWKMHQLKIIIMYLKKIKNFASFISTTVFIRTCTFWSLLRLRNNICMLSTSSNIDIFFNSLFYIYRKKNTYWLKNYKIKLYKFQDTRSWSLYVNVFIFLNNLHFWTLKKPSFIFSIIMLMKFGYSRTTYFYQLFSFQLLSKDCCQVRWLFHQCCISINIDNQS